MNSIPTAPETREQYNDDLFAFLAAAPTAFHAVAGMAARLDAGGFVRLQEKERWDLSAGAYYTVRDDSAVVAFILGSDEPRSHGFRIVGAHTDSPALQLKPLPVLCESGLHRLGVEVYGGPILSTWFDRDLSLAGRVAVRFEHEQHSRLFLVHFDRPLLSLPSIAIHLDREAAEHLNRQRHLPPILLEDGDNAPDFDTILTRRLAELYPQQDFTESEVITFDLFCHDLTPPCISGFSGEFIHAGRLDNLLSCHAGLTALLAADRSRNALLYCSNHEEIGSLSSSGARGNLLTSVLHRLLPTPGEFSRATAGSFLISLDNAHATHPNWQDKSDPAHAIRLNRGPVIKYNAGQRYATSAASAAIFCDICSSAGITPQKFVMRSDAACGSTIGPMTAAALGLRTVDAGAASFAMHSIREMTGSDDPLLCCRTVAAFYQGDFHLR